jgi:hypothetical protein
MKENGVRNAHVRPGLPRARQAEGELAVRLSFGEGAERLMRDGAGRVADHQGAEYHSPEGHDAITAVLVQCTLGQAHRPELQRTIVDPETVLAISRGVQHLARSMRQALDGIGATLTESLAKLGKAGRA